MEKYNDFVKIVDEIKSTINSLDNLKSTEQVDSAKVKIRELFDAIAVKSVYALNEINDTCDEAKSRIAAQSLKKNFSL